MCSMSAIASFIPTVPHYVVMTAAAKMPGSCKFGRYGKVAVVETDGYHTPKQIHPRHAAVRSIVAVWDRLNIGHTERCAYRRALAEAEAMAMRFNSMPSRIAA